MEVSSSSYREDTSTAAAECGIRYHDRTGIVKLIHRNNNNNDDDDHSSHYYHQRHDNTMITAIRPPVITIIASLVVVGVSWWYGIIIEGIALLLFGYGYYVSSSPMIDDASCGPDVTAQPSTVIEGEGKRITKPYNEDDDGRGPPVVPQLNPVPLLSDNKFTNANSTIVDGVCDDDDDDRINIDGIISNYMATTIEELLSSAITDGDHDSGVVVESGLRRHHHNNNHQLEVHDGGSLGKGPLLTLRDSNATLTKMKLMDDIKTKKWRILINKVSHDNINIITFDRLNDIIMKVDDNDTAAAAAAQNCNDRDVWSRYYEDNISKLVNLIFNAVIRTHHISNKQQLYLYIDLLHNISSCSSSPSSSSSSSSAQQNIIFKDILMKKCRSMYDEYVVNPPNYDHIIDDDEKEDNINRLKTRTLAFLFFIGALSITRLLSSSSTTTTTAQRRDDNPDSSSCRCYDGNGFDMIRKWIIDERLGFGPQEGLGKGNGARRSSSSSSSSRYNEYICTIVDGVIEYYYTTAQSNITKASSAPSASDDDYIKQGDGGDDRIIRNMMNTPSMEAIIHLLENTKDNHPISIRDKCLITNVLDKYSNIIVTPPTPCDDDDDRDDTTSNDMMMNTTYSDTNDNNDTHSVSRVRYLTVRGC